MGLILNILLKFWNHSKMPFQDKCMRGYILEEIQTNHWIQNLIITRLPLTIWEGKYCMGDNWCKSHVLKKDNPNFHFSKYLISKIILKSFSSMIRARAETCQKCKLFLFCANTRLIYRKIFSKCYPFNHTLGCTQSGVPKKCHIDIIFWETL